jgi:hypothetical protein
VITIQRDTNYDNGAPTDTATREASLQGALYTLLAADLKGANKFEIAQTTLELHCRPSYGDSKYDVVTYSGPAEEMVVFIKVAAVASRHMFDEPRSLMGYLVNPDGSDFLWGRQLPDLRAVEAKLSTSTWRLYAVLHALSLAPDYEVLIRFDSFARFDDFLAIALTAHELGLSFTEVEAQLAPSSV